MSPVFHIIQTGGCRRPVLAELAAIYTKPQQKGNTMPTKKTTEILQEYLVKHSLREMSDRELHKAALCLALHDYANRLTEIYGDAPNHRVANHIRRFLPSRTVNRYGNTASESYFGLIHALVNCETPMALTDLTELYGERVRRDRFRLAEYANGYARMCYAILKYQPEGYPLLLRAGGDIESAEGEIKGAKVFWWSLDTRYWLAPDFAATIRQCYESLLGLLHRPPADAPKESTLGSIGDIAVVKRKAAQMPAKSASAEKEDKKEEPSPAVGGTVVRGDAPLDFSSLTALTTSLMAVERSRDIASPAKSLAIRARVLRALQDSPRSIDSLADLLKLPRPSVANACDCLYTLGLVAREAYGKLNLYRLDSAGEAPQKVLGEKIKRRILLAMAQAAGPLGSADIKELLKDSYSPKYITNVLVDLKREGKLEAVPGNRRQFRLSDAGRLKVHECYGGSLPPLFDWNSPAAAETEAALPESAFASAPPAAEAVAQAEEDKVAVIPPAKPDTPPPAKPDIAGRIKERLNTLFGLVAEEIASIIAEAVAAGKEVAE